MSSAQMEITILETLYTESLCQCAACALIFYEYFVTISREVDLIWTRKLSGSTIIFFLNRYFLLLYGGVYLLSMFNWTTGPGCEAIFVLQGITSIVLNAIAAVFAALRTYAIGGLDKRSALLAFAFGLVPVAINLFKFIETTYPVVVFMEPLVICNVEPKVSTAVATKLSIITRIASMISEIIVIAVTWKNTFQGWRVASRGAIDASTLTVILRDGTIYFIFLLILNILEVVTAAPLVSESVFGGYVTLFLIPMACILISRFLLNLRRISASGREMRSQRSPSTFTSRADWQTLEFASQFVGNMGALLDYADAGGDDIEEPTAEVCSIGGQKCEETPARQKIYGETATQKENDAPVVEDIEMIHV